MASTVSPRYIVEAGIETANALSKKVWCYNTDDVIDVINKANEAGNVWFRVMYPKTEVIIMERIKDGDEIIYHDVNVPKKLQGFN